MAHVCQLFKSEQDTPKGFLTVSQHRPTRHDSSYYLLWTPT